MLTKPANKKFILSLSVIFPIIMLSFVWVQAKPFAQSYNFDLFTILLLGLSSLGYIIIRNREGGKLPFIKHWPLIVSIYVYLIINLFLSKNIYAGIPRILYLFVLGIFFYLVYDLLDRYLDHLQVLYGFLIITAAYLFLVISEIYVAYSTWWQAVGFLESPPFMYRFVSPFNTSNAFMGLVNMFLPIAIVLFVQNKSKKSRIFLIYWLFFYLIAILFSSSRGGYIGAAAGIFFLGLFNFYRLGLVDKFLSLSRKKQIIIIVLILLIVGAAGYGGYQFLILSSAHPSHGGTAGSLNLNRTAIWKGYLNIWKHSPLLGSGIGRNAFAFFEANNSAPPNFWPTYAHSFPIGILAEFGLLGALLIFSVLFISGLKIFQHYQTISDEHKLVASGVLAGIAAFSAHSLFEDFLNWAPVFFSALALIAWFMSYGETSITRTKRGTWLIISPIISILLLIALWNIAPYRYLDQATQIKKKNSGQTYRAAELADQAAVIAPSSHFYLSQAAFFWSDDGIGTQNVDSLKKANQYFQKSLEIEPAISTMWANKSRVSWDLGNYTDAVEEISFAISLAPNEPVYHLNLGWYEENLQNFSAATTEYTLTLDQSNHLGWHTHPYWQENDFRKEILQNWSSANEKGGQETHLSQFTSLLNVEEKESATILYHSIDWLKSINRISERLMMKSLLSLEENDHATALSTLTNSFSYTYNPLRLTPLSWWDGLVYYRTGYPDLFIPGVLQLSQDFGQLDNTLVENIFIRLEATEETDELCSLYQEYQNAIHGFASANPVDSYDQTCP